MKYTRRKFITTLGAGSALLMLPAIPKFSETLFAGDKKLGIALVGLGNYSTHELAPALQETSLCYLSGIVTGTPEKAERWKQRYDIPDKNIYNYKNFDEIADNKSIDVVYVVLPNSMHHEFVIRAAKAGKHVFCEKPMALTVADCNEMIAVAERTQRAIQIGTQRRHSNGYKKAVETIRKASVGKILSSDVNSYRGDWRVPAEDEYPPGVEYWRLNQDKCGGVVYEMGAHTIDVNNWIFDSEPLTVVSLQDVNDLALRTRNSTDHGGVLVRYANGTMMNYGGNLYAHGPSASDYFFAVNGTIKLDAGNLEINYGYARGFPTQEPLPKPVKMKLPGGDGTSDQWKYFAQVLAGQADPYPDGYIGRQSIKICEGAIISAQEKIVVNVNELT